MTEQQVNDFELRLRKVEDFIISQLQTLLNVAQDLKSRVEELESKDDELLMSLNSSCSVKDKEIASAREDSIRISTEYAKSLHYQTLALLAGMFALFIGAVVFFNAHDSNRALDIKQNETNIQNITRSLDKIDGKLDSVQNSIANHVFSDK